MKSSIMRKFTAILVAVMMLLPMAAQAESASGYYEASVSDLIVNYMGTQLDFTGLNLKVLGGADVDGKNAIAGITATMPDDSKISFAAELGEKEATLLLANKLVTLPYDRMGEALSKLGADVDAELNDVSPIIENMWAEMASAIAVAGDGSAASAGDIAIDTAEIEALVNEVAEGITPTDAERTIDGNTYKGTEIAIDMTAEQASKLISSLIAAVYGNEQVVSSMNAVSEAISGAAAQGGSDMGDVDFATLYSAFVENAQKMSLPNGLKANVFTATADDGAEVVDMKIERCTIDMKDYIEGLMNSVHGEGEIEEGQTSMDFELAMSAITNGEATFIDMAQSMYLTGEEVSYADIYLTLNANQPTGYMNLSMNINPAALGEEGDAGSFTAAANWDEADGKKTIDGSAAAYTGNVKDGEIGFSYARTTLSDTDDNVSIALTASEGDEEPMPVFTLGYDLHHESDADTATNEAVFSMDLAGVLSVSGKLNFASLPMGADKLMSTNATSALNLADATDDEVQSLIASLQSELITAMSSAAQVPGIAALLAVSMGGEATSVDTTEAIAG